MRPTTTVQAVCSACGYQSPRIRGSGYIVLVPDPEGVVTPPHPPVFHPFQDYVLEEFGLNFTQAAWQGCLVETSPKLCLDCRTLYEHHRLSGAGATIGCAGCLAVGGGAIMLGIVLAMFTGNPFLGSGLAVALAVLITFTLELGATVIVRARFPDRVKAVDGPFGCPNCESRRTVTAERQQPPLSCPLCTAPALALRFLESRT